MILKYLNWTKDESGKGSSCQPSEFFVPVAYTFGDETPKPTSLFPTLPQNTRNMKNYTNCTAVMAVQNSAEPKKAGNIIESSKPPYVSFKSPSVTESGSIMLVGSKNVVESNNAQCSEQIWPPALPISLLAVGA